MRRPRVRVNVGSKPPNGGLGTVLVVIALVITVLVMTGILDFYP